MLGLSCGESTTLHLIHFHMQKCIQLTSSILVAYSVSIYSSLHKDILHTRSKDTANRSTPHLVSVDVVQSIKQHLHDLLDLCQGELYIGITQQSSQVMFTEVKNQIDAAFVSVELRSFEKNKKMK